MSRSLLAVLLALTSSLTIVSSALIEQGVENVVSVCSDGNTVYFLNETGKVFSKGSEGIEALDLPDQVVSVQALEGALFFLRTDGTVWQYLGDQVRLLRDQLPTREILTQGNSFYLLKESGFVSSWKNGVFRNLVVDRQFVRMAPYGKNALIFMDRWGRIFKYDTYAEYLSLIDSSPGTIQMVSGNDALVLLKRDGSIHKYEDLEFHRMAISRPVRTIETDGESLFFIDVDRKLWEMDLATDRLHNIEIHGHPDRVFVAGDGVYVTNMEGQVYSYEHSPRAASSRRKFHRLWNTNDFYQQNSGHPSSR